MNQHGSYNRCGNNHNENCLNAKAGRLRLVFVFVLLILVRWCPLVGLIGHLPVNHGLGYDTREHECARV